MVSRICTDCHEALPLTAFYARFRQCKHCSNARSVARLRAKRIFRHASLEPVARAFLSLRR